MPAVHARKDKMITGLTGGIEMLFKKHKIDWIKGTARLTGGKGARGHAARRRHPGDHRDQGTHRRHRIGAALACPASRSTSKRIIFSDEAIHLPQVPKSIAIMGSGAVGVEFASIFKSYGSEVTVIELLPRLVPGEDEAVSAELERTFKKRGLKVHTGTRVTSAKASGHRRRPRDAGQGRQDAEGRPSRCCSSPPAAARSPTASTPRRSG